MRIKKFCVFLLMIVILITSNIQCVLAYEPRSVPPEFTLSWCKIDDLEDLKKQIQDISEEYRLPIDKDEMHPVIKVQVSKNDDGSIYIGKENNGSKPIKWEPGENYCIFGENKNNGDKWEISLELNYRQSVDGLYYYVYMGQCILDDDPNEPYDANEFGWAGQKVIQETNDKVVNGGVGVLQFVVDTIPGIIGGIKDLAENLQKNFIGTIFTLILDVLKFIADILQMIASSFQTMSLNTTFDMATTYSADYLYTDGAGKIKDKGSRNRDAYTNVSKYSGKEGPYTINIDGAYEGFTKETPIPVIPGDLYYIALGEIDLLDINFLTTGNHKKDSPWLYLRNFASSVIHITIYIGAAFLLITLIIHSIGVVTSSFDKPQEKEKHKEGLNKFATSLVMLIGTVVIMAICIYGSKAILSDIKSDGALEGPIRVNVKTAEYSFSTTVTGYFRYMAEIEDVDRFIEKGVNTFAYIGLVLTNCAAMIFMFLRMILMMFLAIIGPIVATLHVLDIKGPMTYKQWVTLYIKLSCVQLVMAVIYRIILEYLI